MQPFLELQVQEARLGYALGKQRGMFSILLTRVGEACQGVEQFYLGNVRFFFFFFLYGMSAASIAKHQKY